jgi:serine/threonine protein kinase
LDFLSVLEPKQAVFHLQDFALDSHINMHMPNDLLTPPHTPPPQQYPASRCLPPTPESRIGKFLGASLELKEILGTGAYGVVYSAIDHCTGIWYAVKALSKTNQNGEPLDRRQKEFQSREIKLHYSASAHPNIVSMLKILDDNDCTYVILEYCPEGDLFSNITERGQYVSNDAAIRKAFLQILDAVEHCHKLGIYHRDLKPENILVSKDQVLLADFGLATTDPESEDHGCGSTFYMSPGRPLVHPFPLYHLTTPLSSECLDQNSRRPSYRCAPNDVWSLGVILVNLTCGRNPWKQASTEDSTYKAFTRNRNFLKTILPLSDELNDILGMVFERNPEERITVSQLKRRIFECSQFTGPAQQSKQLSTPPQSPVYSGPSSYYPSPPSSCSDDSDCFSDPESLDSASSSDEEDSDSDFDSSDSAMDQDREPQFEVFEPHVEAVKSVSPAPITPIEKRPTVPYSRPNVPFPQQYVLPQKSLYQMAPSKQNPYYPVWAPYSQHFDRRHAAYQSCYTPPPQHYPFYAPQPQYASGYGY